MSYMCTVLPVAWLIVMTSCGTYIWIHPLYKAIKYLACIAYMPNVVDIFISSTHLELTWEVCFEVGGILAHVCELLSLYTHLACLPCDLHLKCGSHIFSVIYANYVYIETDSSHLTGILGQSLSTVAVEVYQKRPHSFSSVIILGRWFEVVSTMAIILGRYSTQLLLRSTRRELF